MSHFTTRIVVPSGIQTPLQIFGANLKQWINHDRYATIDGSGNIELSADGSGNNADVNQTNPAYRPFAATGPNGKTVADHDGVNEYMQFTGAIDYFNFIHNGGDAFIVHVLKQRSGNNGFVADFMRNFSTTSAESGYSSFYDDRGGANPTDGIRTTVARKTAGSPAIDNRSSDSFVTVGSWFVFSETIDADNGTAADRSTMQANFANDQKNNTFTGSPIPDNPPYKMQYMGLEDGRFSILRGSDVQWAETIICDAHPTAQQVSDLTDYLNNEWALGI